MWVYVAHDADLNLWARRSMESLQDAIREDCGGLLVESHPNLTKTFADGGKLAVRWEWTWKDDIDVINHITVWRKEL